MTQSTAPHQKSSGKKKTLVVLFVVLLILAAGISGYYYLIPEEIAAVASFPVQQGEFVISLILKGGELESIEAENITAPQVRGQLQITHLFPEGEQVDVGDLLAEFDKVEFEKRVTETEQALEASKADLEKTTANQEAMTAQLKGEILNQEAQLRLSQLQVEKMKFESSVQKEEAKLRARQAELRLEQAQKKYGAQKIVDGADTKKRDLQIARKKRDLEKAQKDLNNLSVKAEKPGLVVYGKKWSPSGPVKVRVGDEIWGGQTLITLPDLSHMQVKTYVNEVEVDKLKVEQKVLVKLDALPEPTFHGSITSIANLGREKEGEKNVKVFDVVVEIDENDTRLKPGMTATSEVIVETIPPRPEPVPDSVRQETTTEIPESVPEPLYIPLDAVFEANGETVVFRLVDGRPVEQVVVLGKKNDNYVVIEEGLGPDDRVTLRNPSLLLDELGGIPAKEGQESKAAPAE
jgi:HlyD family secretion protein